jgi:DNA-binding NarL/FixJ family response regulator
LRAKTRKPLADSTPATRRPLQQDIAFAGPNQKDVNLTMKSQAIRVLILDDNASDAELTISAVARAGGNVETRWVSTKSAFVDALHEFDPDIVVTDQMPGPLSAISVLDTVRTITPATPVIVVSGSNDEREAVSSIRAGVEDIVSKWHLARLPAAITGALNARRRMETLSPRQLQVFRLIAEGHTTREIGRKLRVSVKTAETHRTEVMKRLNLHDVVSVVRYAVRVGIVPASET